MGNFTVDEPSTWKNIDIFIDGWNYGGNFGSTENPQDALTRNEILKNTNSIGFANLVFALGIPGDMPIASNWDGLP